MSRFSIPIYDNTGRAASIQDIGPIAERVRVTTVLPGGCGELSFRVPHPMWVVPNWVGPNYRVDVLDNEGIFWAGRMERFQALNDPSTGEYWEIIAIGFAANGDDQLYTAQDVNGLQTSAIVTNVVTNLMPQIGATSIEASAVTLSAATAITLKMLKSGQVIGWASLLGDSGNNPQQWHVYPRADRTILLTFEDRPTTAGYRLSVNSLKSYRFGFDMARFANRVSGQYNASASVVTVNDTDLQGVGPGGVNVIRAAYFVDDEITQSADATQQANALLTRLKQKRMSATSLVVNPNSLITDSSNQPVSLWRVRAGKIVWLIDITAAGINTSLMYNNSALVVGTEYDEESGILTLTPESYESLMQMEVARASQLLEGRHTVQT